MFHKDSKVDVLVIDELDSRRSTPFIGVTIGSVWNSFIERVETDPDLRCEVLRPDGSLKIRDTMGWTDIEEIRRKTVKPELYDKWCTITIKGNKQRHIHALGGTRVPIFDPACSMLGYHGRVMCRYVFNDVYHLFSTDMVRVINPSGSDAPYGFTNVMVSKVRPVDGIDHAYVIYSKSSFFNIDDMVFADDAEDLYLDWEPYYM